MNLLAELLDRAADSQGEAIAWKEGGQSETYRSFRRAVQIRAARLLEAGLKPSERIALLAKNGVPFLEATLAAAYAGVVLVPLNVRESAEALAEVLRRADVKGLLLDPRDAALSELGRSAISGAAAGGQQIWCASISPGTAEGEGLAEPVEAAVHAPAQLYFTSGSTGRPKGVILSYENIRTHTDWAIQELALGPTDVWAHIAPMFHLADAWASFAITAVAGTHVHLPQFQATEAFVLLARGGVTLTNLVPTMLNAMVHDQRSKDIRVPSMRAILSGGAPIAESLVRKIMDRFQCLYIQTYGMTETSPYLTLSKLLPEHESLDEATRFRLRARTGRPFGKIALRVVDHHGEEIPHDDFSIGEIQVRGKTVTPGYWQDEEATLAAFTEDGWLRTGDLARVDSYGFVQIVDRAKDVIITGGEKVYSVEVEARLAAEPTVLECAVFPTEDPYWGEVVTAAVVRRDPQIALDFDALNRALREHLAAYKVPKRYLELDVLPRLGSGKIDKRGLRRLGASASDWNAAP